MSEKLMPFDEFMEALPCCDTVKVILTGCGESVFETKPIYEGICKLANRRAERTGRWIPEWMHRAVGKPKDFALPKCSQCKHISNIPHRFCPNCGAKMDGEKEGV